MARHYDMTARAAKAAATRERILASAIGLYQERSLDDFTLDEIAERSGATVQTVLRAFGSKEDLVLTALGRLAAEGVPLKATPPGDVAAAVHALYDLYETVGDLQLKRLADEQRRPALKPYLDEGRAHHNEWVRKAFAPQLARTGGSARSRLFTLLLVATDVYVWKLLRRELALGRHAAEALVATMIAGVIDAEAPYERALAELVGRRQPAAQSRNRTSSHRTRT